MKVEEEKGERKKARKVISQHPTSFSPTLRQNYNQKENQVKLQNQHQFKKREKENKMLYPWMLTLLPEKNENR